MIKDVIWENLRCLYIFFFFFSLFSLYSLFSLFFFFLYSFFFLIPYFLLFSKLFNNLMVWFQQTLERKFLINKENKRKQEKNVKKHNKIIYSKLKLQLSIPWTSYKTQNTWDFSTWKSKQKSFEHFFTILKKAVDSETDLNDICTIFSFTTCSKN